LWNLQLVYKVKFNQEEEVCRTLDKLSRSPKELAREFPLIAHESIKIKVVQSDVQVHKTSIDVKIPSVLAELGGVTLQLFPSTGKINMFCNDPIGKQLGLRIISKICKEYHLEKTKNTVKHLQQTNQQLERLSNSLVMQLHTAMEILARHIMETQKIPYNKAQKRAQEEFENAFKEPRRSEDGVA
jgi:hypothetical protein